MAGTQMQWEEPAFVAGEVDSRSASGRNLAGFVMRGSPSPGQEHTEMFIQYSATLAAQHRLDKGCF